MFVYDLVVLLAVAFAGIAVGRLLRIPPLVAYLLAGVIAGPGVMGLLATSEVIEELAELGVALLLFGVGIEFSLDRLRRTIGRLLVSGAVQVGASVFFTALAFHTVGADWPTSLVAGFLVSLSSTAMVFKLYSDRGEIDAPHGQAATGILLFQDLALVPMILVLPVLSGSADDVLSAGMLAFSRAAVAVALLMIIARTVLPRALEYVAHAATPELFPLLAVLTAMGMALCAHMLGLSLPIGMFLAGLALSDSPFAHQVFAELIPLRDVFIAVFFTSVGMIFQPQLLASSPGILVLMALAVLIKGLICGLVVGIGWRSLRLGILAGLGLAQIGEFSFVLAREAGKLDLMSDELTQAFLGTAIVTMAATPFLVMWARRLAETELPVSQEPSSLEGHVVVAGYDRTGHAVARVLKETKIPFVAVDMTPSHVAQGKREAMPVHFGDASRRAVLASLGTAGARAVVVAVSDPSATRRIVSLARQMNGQARILVRAHSVDEIEELERLGADEVVPAEFAASIELFVRLLMNLGVPRHVARMQESIIRLAHYRAFRGPDLGSDLLDEIERLIRAGVMETAEVMADSPACGRSLAELTFQQSTGASILALVRNDEPLRSLGGDTRLQEHDLVVLYGPHAAVAKALETLQPRRPDALPAE